MSYNAEPAACQNGVVLPRLHRAMGAYAVIGLLAFFTLDGVFRYGVWILLGGLAAKTYIAHKAGW